MADAVKLKLGYCDQCTPIHPLGVGLMPSAPKHRDPKSGTMHEGKTVEIDALERKMATEEPSEFLARMVKKYLTKK